MSPPPSRVITRNRERLACKDCRRRKLKCDRSSPCSSCVRRGHEASCTYQQVAQAAEDRLEQRIDTQARLVQLEQRVQQLSSQPCTAIAASSILTSPIEVDEIGLESAQQNVAVLAEGGSSYNGSTHWSAMLKDIQELRLALPVDDNFVLVSGTEGTDGGDEGTGIELLFGGATPLPLDVILATYLPPRLEVDRMISAYFRAEAVAAPFIHSSQFLKLYQQFWENIKSASPLWISILFSICHIASNTLGPGKAGGSQSNQFSVAAAHCLVAGHYFRPKRFAVEALTLFSQAQCITSSELPSDIGALIGLVIRIATQMGYHKDPERLHLSPFDKEMRRRAWSFCMQLDLIISFHLGLPTSVQFPTWDTKIPRALLDSDFDECSLELPPSRPDSDINHMSFSITKHKFMAVFEKILRHSLSTNPNPAEVGTLDTEVRVVFAALPEKLKPRPMADSVVDPANLIVTRLCVSFVYWKCLCVLHRPYVTRGRAESVAVCYEVASRLVGGFVDAYYEFIPGGQAETEKWFLSAVTWHDVLFGIMGICLVICASQKYHAVPVLDIEASIELLGKARNICADQEARRHKDTKRIMLLVDAIILRFGTDNSSNLDLSLPEPSYAQEELAMGEFAPFQNSASWDVRWDQDDYMTGITQDPSWDYFEQYLDLNVKPQ